MHNFTRNLLPLFFLFFVSSSLFAASGGPDAYGYVWKDNTEPNGPAVNFIDISQTGTQLTGLGDDNSIGPVSLGFNFHYYWGDFNQVRVGSNGWLSFDQTSNIASCFSNIPMTGGAGDNFVAPLLSDLIFSGAGNPAVAYSWSNNVDTAIIAFYNVPFWQAAAPGYYGVNTFEVIFSGVDSSITFQYNTMNTTYNSGCVINIVGGIESIGGSYGLQTFSNTIPGSYTAVKFEYPDSVLINVPDARPAWNQTASNGALFYPTGSVNLSTNLANSGNVDLTNTTTVTAKVKNLGGATVYNSSATVSSLNQGQNTTLNFTPAANLNSGGQYYFEAVSSNSTDINSANDSLLTELEIVDLTGPTALLSYVENASNEGGLGWSGGDSSDGVAIYMEPPVYPVSVSSYEFYISATATGGSFAAVIYDDNGPNGSPGTVLDSQVVATPTAGQWYTVQPPSAINITSGGYYIAWYMTGGAGMNIGTRITEPISRRSYEILGNSWAEYRDNNGTDFMIRSTITGYPCSPSASFSTQQVGPTTFFTNTSNGGTSISWDLGDGTTATTNTVSHQYSQAGVYNVCLIVNDPSCGSDTTCDSVTICINATAAFSDSADGLDVYFTDQGAQATDWLWDFGDGNSSTMQNPMHSYSAPGYYDICLISSNFCSSDTTCMDSVLICVPPSAGFTHTVDTAAEATFTNSSTGFGAVSYFWDFGDGNTDTSANPVHQYQSYGTYYACLTITDVCGSDTICDSVQALAPVGMVEALLPGVRLYPNPTSGVFRMEGKWSGGGLLRVFDALGHTIVEQGDFFAGQKALVDLHFAGKGVYFVELQTDEGWFRGRLVVLE